MHITKTQINPNEIFLLTEEHGAETFGSSVECFSADPLTEKLAEQRPCLVHNRASRHNSISAPVIEYFFLHLTVSTA